MPSSNEENARQHGRGGGAGGSEWKGNRPEYSFTLLLHERRGDLCDRHMWRKIDGHIIGGHERYVCEGGNGKSRR